MHYGCYILPSLKEFIPEFTIANERMIKELYVYKLLLTSLKEVQIFFAHGVLQFPCCFPLRLISP
jgi:hypothetical protein